MERMSLVRISMERTGMLFEPFRHEHLIDTLWQQARVQQAALALYGKIREVRWKNVNV
ncbi:hypothetical protein SVI_3072 [Shewanella violacea DSS12]|uniref:Uncharacterized protein n=1 Tax=Shewanella violacea (strain JCM 10179 / CIP 106290 / LMG 19151 / DSS12) TaxID=637905 RepID=D4ZAJ8_SHEVD|nr:hypothetical protein SVI_3072 [Shewanella violacea DSS12]